MGYKLPPKVKPYIDSLGPDYKNVDPRLLQGANQVMLDVAFTSAKKKFFKDGWGFPHLGWDNVEIRVWPGQTDVESFPIAFCFGVTDGFKTSDYVYVFHLKGKKGANVLQDWLTNLGYFAAVH